MALFGWRVLEVNAALRRRVVLWLATLRRDGEGQAVDWQLGKGGDDDDKEEDSQAQKRLFSTLRAVSCHGFRVIER